MCWFSNSFNLCNVIISYMEFDVAVVGAVCLCFIMILSAKLGTAYFKTEKLRIEQDRLLKTDEGLTILREKLHRSNNNHEQTKHKLRKIRVGYDIDYDDIDEDDFEGDKDNEFKISDLAKTIYPKIPPSLSNLIDKEEFQNAIIKTVEKKPDILNTFLDKFINKKDAESNQPINKLQETYL